jgi:hypothetical protein
MGLWDQTLRRVYGMDLQDWSMGSAIGCAFVLVPLADVLNSTRKKKYKYWINKKFFLPCNRKSTTKQKSNFAL